MFKAGFYGNSHDFISLGLCRRQSATGHMLRGLRVVVKGYVSRLRNTCQDQGVRVMPSGGAVDGRDILVSNAAAAYRPS